VVDGAISIGDVALTGPVERVRSTLMNGIRSMPVGFTAVAVTQR
jgi:hypothetical protein